MAISRLGLSWPDQQWFHSWLVFLGHKVVSMTTRSPPRSHDRCHGYKVIADLASEFVEQIGSSQIYVCAFVMRETYLRMVGVVCDISYFSLCMFGQHFHARLMWTKRPIAFPNCNIRTFALVFKISSKQLISECRWFWLAICICTCKIQLNIYVQFVVLCVPFGYTRNTW